MRHYTLLERKMSDLIETFKRINVIPNYGRQLFNISPRYDNIQSRQISKIDDTDISFFILVY